MFSKVLIRGFVCWVSQSQSNAFGDYYCFSLETRVTSKGKEHSHKFKIIVPKDLKDSLPKKGEFIEVSGDLVSVANSKVRIRAQEITLVDEDEGFENVAYLRGSVSQESIHHVKNNTLRLKKLYLENGDNQVEILIWRNSVGSVESFTGQDICIRARIDTTAKGENYPVFKELMTPFKDRDSALDGHDPDVLESYEKII